MKIRLTILVALVLAAAVTTADSDTPPFFPYWTKTPWTYEGTVRWTEEGTNKVRKKRIRWQTSIERHSNKGARWVALVRGFPFELAWYEPGREPGYSVMVEDLGRIEVELCESRAEAEELMKRALDGESVGEAILRSPLKIGDCAGGEERADKRYCWLVEKEISGKHGSGWRIVHRTNPDHQILDLVPLIGITRYVFEHHGTVASVDVKLVQ